MISNREPVSVADTTIRMVAAAASLLMIGAFVGCGQAGHPTGGATSMTTGGGTPPPASESSGAAGSTGAGTAGTTGVTTIPSTTRAPRAPRRAGDRDGASRSYP